MIKKGPKIVVVSVIFGFTSLFAQESQNSKDQTIKIFVSAKNNVLNLKNKSFNPANAFLSKGKYKVTAEVDAFFAASNNLPAKKVTFSAVTKLGPEGYTWVLKDGETIEIETVDTEAFGYFVEGDSNDNSGGATLTIIKSP